jgi:isoquinoline 1-oxidoreductase beta subunit
MEPLNCTVKITKDQCEIWTGTQWPELCQKLVAAALGFSPSQIVIHSPFIGGSFGRRGSFDVDWVVEAVEIAKATGKPIKLVWTREDDIKGGYYRPAYLHRVEIGVNTEGFPNAWQHRVIGQSLFVNTALEGMIVHNGIDYGSVDGVNGSPHFEHVPDHSLQLLTTKQPVPVLPWRAVGNTHTAFVMESVIDELAVAAGKDPVEYRRILLRNQPRHLAALNLAVEKSEWDKGCCCTCVHGKLRSAGCRGICYRE